MSRALILLIGIGLLALLGWFCVDRHGPDIEADLTQRTEQALRKAGVADVQVLLDGRGVALQGTVVDATARGLAEDIASNVYGVRGVDNQLQLTALPQPEPAVAVEQPVAPLEEPEPEAPIAAAASCQAEFDDLLQGESVQFQSGAATIKSVSYQLLERLTAVANTCPSARIVIAGHTDSSGAAASNKQLSERRAASVRNYLSEQGVDPERLSSVGYGEEQPKVSNATPAGRAQNRRVELVVEGI